MKPLAARLRTEVCLGDVLTQASTKPEAIRKAVGETRTLQGNLDPCALYGSHTEVELSTKNMLDSFTSNRHIVNLGHGVYPDIDPDKVRTFINTVKAYDIKK